MKQVSIKILSKGDTLSQFDGNRLIVKKKNGEFWIYEISPDSVDGLPTLNKDVMIKIVSGKVGTVEVFDTETEIAIKR